MIKKLKCEICEEYFGSLDRHHIHSTSLGGHNSKWNISHLCPNCHRDCHTGKIIIEGRFTTTIGEKVIWRSYNEESITGIDDPPVYIIGEK